MKRFDSAFLQKQLNVRDVIFQCAYDEKELGNKERYKVYDRQVDRIRDNILADIIANFSEYPVDEVLETLTRFGQAPCLVYDDNGKFAVSGDGYQPVVTGNELIEGGLTTFVEAHMWKKTVREALFHYLTYEEPSVSREDTQWIDDILRENGFDPSPDS